MKVTAALRQLAWLTLCLLGSGYAAVADTPPPSGQPRPFVLPDHETLSLDNGLDVTLIPFGNIPKVSVVITVGTGNLHEGEKIWLADFAGDLMQEGAGGKSAVEVAGSFADMGGSLNVGVGMERTSISASGLSEFAPRLVRELAAVVMTPELPADQLERIRADRLRTLSVARSQPGTLASEAFSALLYGDHAYGRILPSPEQLASITIADVRDYYGRNFGARRSHVYVSGLFEREQVLQAITETLGGWKRGPQIVRDVPQAAGGPQLALIQREDAAQSTIYLGLSAPDPSKDDFVAFNVLNTLLGGNLSSRITTNLREDKGYTYSPRSSIAANYRASFWRLSADVTPEHTADSIREVFKEIRRLQREPPGDEELQGVKNYLAGNFVMQNATRGGLIGQLAYLNFHGLPLKRLTDYVETVHAVQPTTVSALARQYLSPEKMLLVVVGDVDSLRQQLRDLPEFRALVAQ